ncbi:MAG: UTP--glucose-1-phosphate uridylyltransferase GalU [Endozoicomonas sp.]
MLSKCLFPVAGYGTRFLPATKSMPKEMLPVVDKPLIQYGVEEAMLAGLTDLGFVNGRNKRAIPDHFDINYELEAEIAGSGKEEKLSAIREVMAACTFSYTRQNQMLGLGHAIRCGKTLIGDQPFGVILADDLCLNDEGPLVMAQLVELYKQFRCTILAVQEVPESEVDKYGVIAGDALSDNLIRVTDMVEKPDPSEAPSNLAVIGRYILTPDIFDIIDDTKPGINGEVQLTDAILTQAQQGCVIACKFSGKRYDCGSIDGFVEATNAVYQKQLQRR